MAIDQKFKDGYVNFIVPNVPVYWCHLTRPDTAFGDSKWSIEMRLPDGELAKNLKDSGFNMKDKKDKQGNIIKNCLVAKKATQGKEGPNKAPMVVHLDGKTPFTEDIGNGSICNVKVQAKAWKVNGKWILSLYLEGVQVVEHVAYNGGGFEDLTGGSDVPF